MPPNVIWRVGYFTHETAFIEHELYVCYDATLQYNKHFKTLILCNIIV